jgi:AraC-like DNA-binding protein
MWTLSLGKGFSVRAVPIFCEFIQNTSDWEGTPEQHDAFELIYPVRGHYQVRVDGQMLAGSPGDVFLYPPGKTHEPSLPATGQSAWFALQWSPSGDLPDSPAMLKLEDARGRIGMLVRWLWEERWAAPSDVRQHHALLVALISELRRLAEESAAQDAFGRVVQIMRTDMHRPLHMAELAKVSDVSVNHFIREFRKRMGETPGRYLQRLRLERALQLLQNSHEPLKQIARRVGFQSLPHLTALVRRETGLSPGEYRAKYS